nr:hypothetical protein CFP56_72531 [Quercus suber]
MGVPSPLLLQLQYGRSFNDPPLSIQSEEIRKDKYEVLRSGHSRSVPGSNTRKVSLVHIVGEFLLIRGRPFSAATPVVSFRSTHGCSAISSGGGPQVRCPSQTCNSTKSSHDSEVEPGNALLGTELICDWEPAHRHDHLRPPLGIRLRILFHDRHI